MKTTRLFGLPLMAAALIGAASCSNEEIPQAVTGDGNVTLTATLPDGMLTRAFGDGNTATRLSYAVYNAGSTTPIAGMTVDGDNALTMSGRTATVNLKLVTGRSYDIIFWAESEPVHNATGTKPYTVTWDGQILDVNYNEILSNDENRDAFFVKHTIEVNGPVSEEVVLRRPFAQVNFGSDDLNESAVTDAFGADLKTSLKTQTYTQLNLGNGEVANQVEITYEADGLPQGENFPYEPETYGYVSMNYLLVPASRSIVDLELAVSNAAGVINTVNVSAAPVQRNFRTNIYGSLLTSAADFNVRIDPIFDQPDINVEEIKPVEPETDGNTYSITSAEELAWIAKTVNEGNNLNGKTISIDADIDFGYKAWTPIGTAKTALSADIEGNGHTISNMYIEHDECVGFVGYTWRKVKDLTFLNPIVKGHHWVGVVVGLTQDGCPQFGIENITVENATVTVTPWLKNGSYDDGDKAGVIMGYFPAAGGDAAIRNCTVRNSTVTAFRDLGSIVGYGTYTVTGNTAENVQLIQDMTNGYYPQILVQNRWGEINGYKSDKTTDNTATNVTHTITGN
ncbi:MAG: hypothetical protein K2L59_07605 [Muribaculaceae bacterium]|nr:hypothetical protein [Muribaculaceae bacterium]